MFNLPKLPVSPCSIEALLVRCKLALFGAFFSRTEDRSQRKQRSQSRKCEVRRKRKRVFNEAARNNAEGEARRYTKPLCMPHVSSSSPILGWHLGFSYPPLSYLPSLVYTSYHIPSSVSFKKRCTHWQKQGPREEEKASVIAVLSLKAVLAVLYQACDVVCCRYPLPRLTTYSFVEIERRQREARRMMKEGGERGSAHLKRKQACRSERE